MMKWIKAIGFAMLLATMSLSALQINSTSIAGERMYVNSDDVDASEDAFMIHVGENLWIEAGALYRDATGLYTCREDIKGNQAAYEKKWRCPYCNRYYSIGQRCSNPDCPSKY